MSIWYEVLMRVLNGISEALFNELFWIIVALVAVQHWRIAKNRERFFGIQGGSVVMDTLYATFFGVLGGVLGSFLLVLTGVSLDGIGISYIWPLALLLMLISPRFLCFSYAGGIIALTSLLFDFPRGIQVPQLMALVAILHMVESFLILVSGHRGAVPIYTKNQQLNTVVGGFTLQKFWPIPLMALLLVSAEAAPATGTLTMPKWWPVLKPYVNDTIGKVYTMIPVLAALGYGDLALARTPGRKSIISARNLSIYSLVLLALALLSSRFSFLKVIAALFAPLGHELIIYLGQRMEMREKPIFVPPAQGVMVLEAVSHTLAGDMGIKPGDIIFSLNGIPVNNKNDIEWIIAQRPAYLQIEYVARDTKKWHRKVNVFKRGQALGIIPVPDGHEVSYMELNTRGFLAKMWQKLIR